MAELTSLGDTAPFVAKDASETVYDSMKMSKKRRGGDIAAVFVHAGAGYHSFENEHVHLAACSDAASVGMKFLKAGSTAVEAVEAAIRVLEDNEITNAGYGSNLAIDGTVECDASIVDHYGRSGAVGAMGQVMHPIHVARLVLEGSTQRLTLRRVPPNLLVGQGAIDFAYEQHVPILMPDGIVSQAAKERYRRWQKDLADATNNPREKDTSTGSQDPDEAILAPLANEAQPVTPAPPRSSNFPPPDYHTMANHEQSPQHNFAPMVIHPDREIYDEDGSVVRQQSYDEHHISLVEHLGSPNASTETSVEHDVFMEPAAVQPHDQPGAFNPNVNTDGTSDFLAGQQDQSNAIISMHLAENRPLVAMARDDSINDTVGAIAIDGFGNIAAGSSSGGIGMKRRGRTGPAALVGIGTAVHPVHPEDNESKTTAVVTSGTGEHMATTLAAGTCADRLYYGLKLTPEGNMAEANDEEALQNFVQDGFMGHPSVRHSNTAAAIGVMAVKKTAEGVWFHFAHNTDSFAVCSMTSEDAEPLAVMSRTKAEKDVSRHITTGARSCTWRQPKEEVKEAKRRKKSKGKEAKSSPKDTPSSSKKSRFMHMAFSSTDGYCDMP